MKKAYAGWGLWLFIICSLLFGGCCAWVYNREAVLKNILSGGEEHIATIISKTSADKNKNELLVVFNTNSGKTITQKTSAYVIKSEWENFEAGKLVSVIYVERSRQLFIQQVLMRKLENEKRQYFLSGIWLLVGVALYIFIPNSKKPKPKTMYLYL